MDIISILIIGYYINIIMLAIFIVFAIIHTIIWLSLSPALRTLALKKYTTQYKDIMDQCPWQERHYALLGLIIPFAYFLVFTQHIIGVFRSEFDIIVQLTNKMNKLSDTYGIKS